MRIIIIKSMWICSCKGLRETDLKEIIDKQELQTSQEVKDACGAGADCGSCELRIRLMLKDCPAPTNKTKVS